MFKKVSVIAIVLGAAAMAPIGLFSAADCWKAVRSVVSTPPAGGATRPSGPMPLSIPSSTAGEVASVRDLGEIFRFDVTPGWIIQRWSRVSTGLAKPLLEGYRVSLVTGTTPSDLAGALTYYFNSEQHVQQITFCGTTGDLGRLVRLLSMRYRFTQRLANDPGVVIYEAVNAANQPISLLRVKAAEVVKANDPRRRFVVELVLERPDSS